jgi:hypothetical protein
MNEVELFVEGCSLDGEGRGLRILCGRWRGLPCGFVVLIRTLGVA